MVLSYLVDNRFGKRLAHARLTLMRSLFDQPLSLIVHLLSLLLQLLSVPLDHRSIISHGRSLVSISGVVAGCLGAAHPLQLTFGFKTTKIIRIPRSHCENSQKSSLGNSKFENSRFQIKD